MSDIEDRISELESAISGMEYSIDEIDYHEDMLISLQREIAEIKAVIGLAVSPSESDQEQYKTLREAFEKYEFTKKLILGDD